MRSSGVARSSVALECAQEFREASCAQADSTVALEFRAAQSLPEKSGAVGAFFITPHAVTRYIERKRPRITRDLALRELIYITSLAHHVGPYRGLKVLAVPLELWRGPRFGRLRQSQMRFVVARNGEGEKPQVVTVL